jgi:hypothetical protein
MTEPHVEDQHHETSPEVNDDYDPSRVEPDFIVDEPSKQASVSEKTAPLASSDRPVTDVPLAANRPTADDASFESRRPKDVQREGSGGHRISGPSQVLFLPNMSPHANERDLADLSKRCPGKVKKTFMYMSSSAHHGFVECESIDDAASILDWINNSYIEVRGKRVFAEFSRRKNVEDRPTYEHRQSIRKEHTVPAPRSSADRGPYRKDDYVDDRGPYRRDRGPSYRSSPPADSGAYRAIDRPPYRREADQQSYRGYRDEPGPRRRSRSPPARGGHGRSPPRSYPPRDDYRNDESYRRERDQYPSYAPQGSGYPQPYDERQYGYESRAQTRPSADYHHPPPSRSYPGYEHGGQFRQPPPQYDDYRPREPAYAPPVGGAPYYQEPLPPYQPRAPQGPVAHPLLSLQSSAVSGPVPVRSTPIGTRHAPYPPYPYK